jgi:serine/threonine protein kinase
MLIRNKIMIIGYGGYGKVWYPPRDDPVISPSIRKNPKYIQRYTNQTLEEIKRGEKARKIFDPQNKISNPVLKIYPRQEDFFSQIMPHREKKFAGDLIEKHRGKIKYFWPVMTKMIPILNGLSRVHNKKMVHRDIKTNNFVFDEKPELRIYLIDWGTSIPFSEVYNEKLNYWLTTTKQNLPPEYKIYANVKNMHDYIHNDVYKDFSENELMPLFEFFEPDYRLLLKETDEEFHRLFSSKKTKSKKTKELLETVAGKVDIYALGVVFAQTLASLVGNKSIPKKPEIMFLIKNMIHPNPFKRWDAKTSMAFLKKIIVSLRKSSSSKN